MRIYTKQTDVKIPLSMEGYNLRRRHTIYTEKQLFKITAAALSAGLCLQFMCKTFPRFERILYGATLVSAAMNMPEGTIELTKQRFKDELLGNEENKESFTEDKEDKTSSKSDNDKDKDKSDSEAEFTVTEPLEPVPIDDIPKESRGDVVARHYEASESDVYIPFGSGIIKNSTNLSRDKVLEYLDMPLEMTIDDTDEPQVLIMHTHATESYHEYDTDYYDKRNASWRSCDNTRNVVRVGEIITQELNDAGIVTLQDKTQHDYPSYNGSYDRSAETVKGYLEKYPSIKVVIDVHRDAIQAQDGTVYKAISEINGENTAQVMIIAGCDDGTMNMPEWDKNLRFAANLQSTMEENYPGLTRPVFFCHRHYNQDLTNGSLLLEFGSHGNTLAECERTAHYVGRSMAELLNSLKK